MTAVSFRWLVAVVSIREKARRVERYLHEEERTLLRGGGAMHDLTVTQETFELLCRSCGHSWEAEYETRRSREWAGAEMVEFLLNGLPAFSPYDGVPCPRCRDIRTAVTPQIRSVRSAVPGQSAGTRLNAPGTR